MIKSRHKYSHGSVPVGGCRRVIVAVTPHRPTPPSDDRAHKFFDRFVSAILLPDRSNHSSPFSTRVIIYARLPHHGWRKERERARGTNLFRWFSRPDVFLARGSILLSSAAWRGNQRGSRARQQSLWNAVISPGAWPPRDLN